MPEERFDIDSIVDGYVKIGGTRAKPIMDLPKGTKVELRCMPDVTVSEMGQYVGWYWFGCEGESNGYVAGPDPGSYSFSMPDPETWGDHVELDLYVCSMAPDDDHEWHEVCAHAENWPFDGKRYCDADTGPGTAVTAGEQTAEASGGSCPEDESGVAVCAFGK